MTQLDLGRLAHIAARLRHMRPRDTILVVPSGDSGHSPLTYGDVVDLFSALLDAQDRLGRIADWHSQETGPAGTVGDSCDECGQAWKCPTRKMAEGSYVDTDEFQWYDDYEEGRPRAGE